MEKEITHVLLYVYKQQKTMLKNFIGYAKIYISVVSFRLVI